MTHSAEDDLDRPATEAALMAALRRAGARGYHRELDDGHTATYAPRGGTLLVSFEEVAHTLARDSGLPLSFDFGEDKNWSLLHLTAARRSWFRGDAVFAFFDDLSDDVFFDEYDRVIFYGSAAGGFAAAAYSVAAPGARVILVEPQGAIGFDRAGWDKRLRADFPASLSPRYATPPDLIAAAERAVVVFDPSRLMDHVHASLFQGDNVLHIRAHNMAPADDTPLETALEEANALHPLVEAAATRDLSRAEAHRLLRVRHRSMPWTVNFLEEAARRGHTDLALRLIDSMRAEGDRIELRQLRRRVRAVHRGFQEDL